jgi:hypothetical protein
MAAAAIPELHLHQISRWCQQRVPAQVRDQASVEHRVRGRTVTIVERRPSWSPTVGPEWTTMAIAQLRYAPPATPAPLLAKLDADPTGIFWG